MKLQTPKGFRDFLPPDAIKRRVTIAKITDVFEKFGFDPLETPALEYAETLKGKYGEEEKLIYQFKTSGGDEVALKYDQTVPLARVVAQYGLTGAQKLPSPFKRYQIQNAYRGENTQKGRYREFLQCDADIIGQPAPLPDAEILALVYEVYKKLGLDVIIKINDRSLISQFDTKYLAAVDKINKIGAEGVISELQSRGMSGKEAADLLTKIRSITPSDSLAEIIRIYKQMGYPANSLEFDPTLIRGLDYYTGLILEVVLRGSPQSSSLCGGGRWDDMIGKFTGTPQNAIGFAIGLDRTIEAMEENGIFTPNTHTKVLVTYTNAEHLNFAIEITQKLRAEGINSEIWLNTQSKLEKQLKYADSKKIPFVLIAGFENGKLMLKSLETRAQESVDPETALKKLL